MTAMPRSSNAAAALLALAVTMAAAGCMAECHCVINGASLTVTYIWTTLLAGGIDILFIAAGYFGMNLTWRRVAALLLPALSAGIVIACLAPEAARSELFGPTGNLLFPVSAFPDNLIQGYLIMLLLAPLLNRGMRALGPAEARRLIIILTLAVVVCGWIAQNHQADSAMQPFVLIYFYLLGRYMQLHNPTGTLSTMSLTLAAVGSALLLVAMIWLRSLISSAPTLYLGPDMGITPPGILFSVCTVAAMARSRSRSRAASLSIGASVTFYLLFSGLQTMSAAGDMLYEAAASISGLTLAIAALWGAAIALTAAAAVPARAIFGLIPQGRYVVASADRPPTDRPPLPAAGSERSAIRNSAIESVRVVAMSMILIHHFFDNAIADAPLTFPVAHIAMGFLMVCVPLYILISGYMGIRLTLRQLTKLYLSVLFFNIINLILLEATGGIHLTPRDIAYGLVFPLSRTNYWFLRCYLLLMLLSPLLNRALASLDLRGLRAVTAIMLFIEVYCCWLGKNSFGSDSNGLMFMIFLYTVGYWAARDPMLCQIGRWQALAIYLATSLAVGLTESALTGEAGGSSLLFGKWLTQNPLTIAGSVALMLFLTHRTFHSRLINLLGVSSLGCYLLQDGWFGYGWFYDRQHDFYLIHGESPATLGMFVLTFIAIWVAAIILIRVQNLWLPRLTELIVNLIPRQLRHDR